MISRNKLSIFATLLLLMPGCSNTIVSDLKKNENPVGAPQSTNIIKKENSPLFLADALVNKAHKQFQAKNYDSASAYFKQAFEIRSKILGSYHISLTDSLYHIATIHEAREQYNDAEKTYRRAINILKHNKQQSMVNKFLGYLTTLQYQKSSDSTLRELNNLLTSYKQIHDPENIRISAVQHRLANLYLKTKKIIASEIAFKNALLICQQHTGIEHPYYALILNDYSKLLKLTNRNKQAKQLHEKISSILNEFPEKLHSKLYQLD